MDTPVLADPHKLTFISSVQILGNIQRIYQEQWLIRMDSTRDSNESLLLACLDDNFLVFWWLTSIVVQAVEIV